MSVFKKIVFIEIFIIIILFSNYSIYSYSTIENNAEIQSIGENNNIDFTKRFESIDGIGGYSVNDNITVTLDNTDVVSYTYQAEEVNII